MTQAVLDEVLDKVHRGKYERYALRSMVEDSRRLTWCPSPDCQHAIENLTESGSAAIDVVCKCSHAFCFSCHEEAHRPVSWPVPLVACFMPGSGIYIQHVFPIALRHVPHIRQEFAIHCRCAL